MNKNFSYRNEEEVICSKQVVPLSKVRATGRKDVKMARCERDIVLTNVSSEVQCDCL